MLRGDQNYGSGLYWIDLNLTWNITENDSLTAGTWMAWGLNKTAYKELDVYTSYTHTFGALAMSLGYTYYNVLSSTLFSHELNTKAAYTFKLPAGITLTPSLAYFFNIGPDIIDDSHGLAKNAASWLQARVDAGIPIYKNILSLAPWTALGVSFDYNVKQDGSFLTGANNLELGLGLPIRINDFITLYGYGAYSYQWAGLVGTEPSTFWGGAKVVLSF